MRVICRGCGHENYIAVGTTASDYRCSHCTAWLYDEDMPEEVLELTTFKVTITYNVALPKKWVEEHTDDGTGIVTAVVFAAAIRSQVGDSDGYLDATDIEAPEDDRGIVYEALLPPEGVYFQAEDYEYNYEGTD